MGRLPGPGLAGRGGRTLPVKPFTSIRYALPRASRVTLKMFNVLGQEIATLVDDDRSAGTWSAEFIASGLSSGIYFYALRAGGHTEIRRMAVIK